VTTHPIYFLSAIAAFVGALVSIAGYTWYRWPRSREEGWEMLLSRLSAIDRDTVARVALDLVDESGDSRTLKTPSLEPDQIWKLMGGLDGLEVMERNSEVLIDLAAYLQQSYPDAALIADRLRRDAGEIKWHAARLRGAAETGNLQVSFPFYAQRAALSYYRMTCSVLELYQAGNFTLLAELQRAI
jgi:hypothetical protein